MAGQALDLRGMPFGPRDNSTVTAPTPRNTSVNRAQGQSQPVDTVTAIARELCVLNVDGIGVAGGQAGLPGLRCARSGVGVMDNIKMPNGRW